MAKYRTKVTVRTNGKEFKPGTILPDDISAVDLNFLKAKKFVEIVDAAPAVFDDEDDDENGDGSTDFKEINPGEVKTAEKIRKIRSKKEVAAYAASIGLDLGDYESKALKDLQEAVINYQEEQLSGGNTGGAGAGNNDGGNDGAGNTVNNDGGNDGAGNTGDNDNDEDGAGTVNNGARYNEDGKFVGEV